jgi:hypothetical protein
MFFDNAECDTPLNGRLSVAHSYLRAGMIHPQCAACAQSAPTGNNDHRERKHRKARSIVALRIARTANEQ